MIFQIVVRLMLYYVCVLKSHVQSDSRTYPLLSADWLRWDCWSQGQLRCLVHDKKKLARLNQYQVLVIFQIVVSHMLQYA